VLEVVELEVGHDPLVVERVDPLAVTLVAGEAVQQLGRRLVGGHAPSSPSPNGRMRA
jgi:hypothetical protein